ncbi:unnamed protein product, partial [Chrysoparadoxa australica]
SLRRYCSDNSLTMVAKMMRRMEFEKGDVLLEQGDAQQKVYLICEGSVSRLRYIGEQLHQVETIGSSGHRGMFGALHVLRREPTYATALAE